MTHGIGMKLRSTQLTFRAELEAYYFHTAVPTWRSFPWHWALKRRGVSRGIGDPNNEFGGIIGAWRSP